MKKMIQTLMAAILAFTMAACANNQPAKESPKPIEKELMDVKTEFGNLKYPEEYKEQLITSEEKDGDTLTITFSTKIEDKNYDLFQIIVAEDLDEFGYLTDSNGVKRKVSIVDIPLGDISKLPQEQQDQLYAMKEGLNELEQSLEQE